MEIVDTGEPARHFGYLELATYSSVNKYIFKP